MSGRFPAPPRQAPRPPARPTVVPAASNDEDDDAVPPKQLSIADRIAGLKLVMDQKSGSGGEPRLSKSRIPVTLRKASVEFQPKVEPELPLERDQKAQGAYPESEMEDSARPMYFLLSRFDFETLAQALARKPPPIPIQPQWQSAIEDDVDNGGREDQTHSIPPRLPPRPSPPQLSQHGVPQHPEHPTPPPLPKRSQSTKLPTPPPEPKYDTSTNYDFEENQPFESDAHQHCLECRDFSVVDAHAAQFPRQNITSLDQLAYDLTSPFGSETEKARAMFSWMHYNVAYDAQSFLNGDIPPQGPLNTLRTGLAVCDGYAQLFSELCERVGLQAYKVSGHGKGYGYIALGPGQPLPTIDSNHAWNCVLLDGEWRLIDCCWGAGTLDGTTYTPRFDPSWFTSSPLEFGKRHYPTDPSFQLLSEEDGPLSWEDYILAPERPIICGELYNHDLSSLYLEPSTKYLQADQTVSFNLFKRCEHMSTADEDNYVYMIYVDGNMTPLHLNAQGGWEGSIRLPEKSGADVQITVVKTVDGRDAKGIGPKGFLQAKGRKAMSWSVLAMWKIA